MYVTGVNDLSEGDASLVAAASTVNVTPPTLPTYQLINTAGDAGQTTAHITSVTHKVGFMKDSPLDEGDASSALGVVDNDYTSFYQLNDWDDGAVYPDNGGLRFTFDQAYHIGANATWRSPKTRACTAMFACMPPMKTERNSRFPA